MSAPTRRVTPIRTIAADGLAVIRITEIEEDGWESPAWYAVRAVPGDLPHRYALARLGTRRLYCVTVGETRESSTCECLGARGDGSATCRHTGALWALVASGRL